jgi:hypothetical protein
MRKFLVMFVFIASSAHGEIYTWTDWRGIAHYTNKEYDIPPRYRVKAKAMYQEQPASPTQQGGQSQQAKPEGAAATQATAGSPAQVNEAPPASPSIAANPVEQQQAGEVQKRKGARVKRPRIPREDDE